MAKHSAYISYGGLTLTVQQWSELLHIPYVTISARIRKGLPLECVLHQGMVLDRMILIHKGIETWKTKMSKYHRKAVRLAAYDQLKDDYEYFKSLDRAEAA